MLLPFFVLKKICVVSIHLSYNYFFFENLTLFCFLCGKCCLAIPSSFGGIKNVPLKRILLRDVCLLELEFLALSLSIFA